MRIIDERGQELRDPDLDLGQLVPDTIVIAHHPGTPEVPEVREEVLAWPEPGMPEYDERDEDGNLLAALYREIITQEWQPAQEPWDETEDVLAYVPYTEAELEEIEERKRAEEEARKKAEAEAARRAEIEAWLDDAPAHVSDLDEAVVELYEAQAQAQLDTDEAITTLYETLIGGN